MNPDIVAATIVIILAFIGVLSIEYMLFEEIFNLRMRWKVVLCWLGTVGIAVVLLCLK